MSEQPRIAMIDTIRRLMEYDGQRPTYPKLHAATVNGFIPAFRDGRSWFFWESDLPKIAAHFGMKPRQSDAGSAD